MKFCHLQMHLPEGYREININPVELLKCKQHCIGITKWDDRQYYDFTNAETETIIMVRNGNNPIALCQIVSEVYHDENLRKVFLHTDYRNVKVRGWAKDYPVKLTETLFTQGTFIICNKDSEQQRFIKEWYEYTKKKDKMCLLTKSLNRIKNLLKMMKFKF